MMIKLITIIFIQACFINNMVAAFEKRILPEQPSNQISDNGVDVQTLERLGFIIRDQGRDCNIVPACIDEVGIIYYHFPEAFGATGFVRMFHQILRREFFLYSKTESVFITKIQKLPQGLKGLIKEYFDFSKVFVLDYFCKLEELESILKNKILSLTNLYLYQIENLDLSNQPTSLNMISSRLGFFPKSCGINRVFDLGEWVINEETKSCSVAALKALQENPFVVPKAQTLNLNFSHELLDCMFRGKGTKISLINKILNQPLKDANLFSMNSLPSDIKPLVLDFVSHPDASTFTESSPMTFPFFGSSEEEPSWSAPDLFILSEEAMKALAIYPCNGKKLF